MLARRIVRVTFKRKLGILCDVCFRKNTFEQSSKICRREESRGSATQVKFLDFWFSAEEIQVQIPFFQHAFQIRCFYGMLFRNPFVAGTERTQLLTEWKVDIDGNSLGVVTFIKRSDDRLLPQLRCKRRIVPKRNSWIGSVARPGNIIFVDE